MYERMYVCLWECVDLLIGNGIHAAVNMLIVVVNLLTETYVCAYIHIYIQLNMCVYYQSIFGCSFKAHEIVQKNWF